MLSFYTAHFNWQLAEDSGQAGNWPYNPDNPDMVAIARGKLDALIVNIDKVKTMSDHGVGISTSVWGCHLSCIGWNPHSLEGFDHLSHALEHDKKEHFIHGYPVMPWSYSWLDTVKKSTKIHY